MNSDPQQPELPELPKLPDLPRPVESAPQPTTSDRINDQISPEHVEYDQKIDASSDLEEEEIEVSLSEEDRVAEAWDQGLDRPIRSERRAKSTGSSGSRIGTFLLTTIITGALVAGFRFYFSSDQSPSHEPGDEEFLTPNVKFNNRFDYGFESESTDPMEDQRRYIEEFNKRQIERYNQNSPTRYHLPTDPHQPRQQLPGTPPPGQHQPRLPSHP